MLLCQYYNKDRKNKNSEKQENGRLSNAVKKKNHHKKCFQAKQQSSLNYCGALIKLWMGNFPELLPTF